MMLILIFFVLLHLHPIRSSLEWNCAGDVRVAKQQCTITVEYRTSQGRKEVCHARTLALTSLPIYSFSSNHTMQTFRVNFCQLSSIGQLPFSLPSSVERLDLSENALSTFTLAFPLPSNLQTLILDRNENLTEIQFGHPRLHHRLTRLSLRHNRRIQLSSFPASLIELDLTDCNLSPLSLSNLFIPLKNLTHLSLADNHLTQLPTLDERVRLEHLNLSKNQLTVIDEKWFAQHHHHLRMVDLRFNRIQSVEFLQMIKNDNQLAVNQPVRLLLEGNPFRCDCWLGDLLSPSTSIVITDLHLLQCNSHSLMSISRDDLLCNYSRHCTSDCTCCEFEACDCHAVCPDDCHCSHDVQWTRHLVQCPDVNRTEMHLLLPQTITELNYQGNQIEEIKPYSLIGKTALKKLNLMKNNLIRIHNETFCAAMNLEELDLSENPSLRIAMSNLNDFFGCLKKLKHLILSREQLMDFHSISPGWMFLSNPISDRRIRLTHASEQALVLPTSTSPIVPPVTPVTPRAIRHSEPLSCVTCTSSMVSPVTRHLPFIHYNQTLIILVVFLLIFVLLFLMLLILLALCRRKLRRHFTAELQRQRSHSYYYHHPHLHPPTVKTTDSNGNTTGNNESLYEQLPSLSSDSELPFLYNEKKFHPSAPPAASFRQHFCCRPLPPTLTNAHDYQYATSATTTTGYSTPSITQPHQCTAILLWANRLLSPTDQTSANRRPCTLHASPSELQHLQQCLLAHPTTNQGSTTMTDHQRITAYCSNETACCPSNMINACCCRNNLTNGDTYIYPRVHR